MSVTPLKSNAAPISGELDDCFQEVIAMADLLCSLDTQAVLEDTTSRLGIMIVDRTRRALELTGELLTTKGGAS